MGTGKSQRSKLWGRAHGGCEDLRCRRRRRWSFNSASSAGNQYRERTMEKNKLHSSSSEEDDSEFYDDIVLLEAVNTIINDGQPSIPFMQSWLQSPMNQVLRNII